MSADLRSQVERLRDWCRDAWDPAYTCEANWRRAILVKLDALLSAMASSVSQPMETWERLIEEVPALKTTQFEMGTFDD